MVTTVSCLIKLWMIKLWVIKLIYGLRFWRKSVSLVKQLS